VLGPSNEEGQMKMENGISFAGSHEDRVSGVTEMEDAQALT
jgi:hypothetical protein